MDDITAFDGRWDGELDLDCVGMILPIEIVIEDGDMSGQFTVRGRGEEDGTYYISGYVDRKGRISEGLVRGAFKLRMRGNFSGGEGKGQIYGEDCAADWKIALEESVPAEDKVVAATPADDAPPVIEAPGDMRTERPVIELEGRVSDASAIVEFTVNGAAAPLGADGSFHLKRGVALG